MTKLKHRLFNIAVTLSAFVFMVLSMIGSAGFVDIKHAFAATLAGVRTQPTSNIVITKSSYELLFTTASTGTIRTVTIAFPTGFNLGLVTLIERSGIGAGAMSLSGTTLTYTVTSPVSIAAGIPIRFELSNVIHPATPGTYSISITTKDSSGNIIDGPTVGTSPVVQIGTDGIANGSVTSPKLAVGSVTPPVISGCCIVSDGPISRSLMKNVVLNNDPAGNSRGWIPDGRQFFQITEPGLQTYYSVVVANVVNNGGSGGAICADEFNHVFTGDSNKYFVLYCETPPMSTAELRYVVLNIPLDLSSR